jgi:type IV secretion system protein VirB9
MRAFFLVSLCWLSNCGAQGAELPHPLDNDKRLGELLYHRDQVFQIPVGADVATHIVLENGERIISSAPGAPADCRSDAAQWCIVANVGSADIFVKPKSAASLSNNLELVTNRRLYSLHFVQGARTGGPLDKKKFEGVILPKCGKL